MNTTRKWVRRITRNGRAFVALVRTALDIDRPFLAQIVPMRRCNLACGYCNEFEKTAAPVPLVHVEAWLDTLATLGTAAVTCSGGEPLLHPDIVRIVSGIRSRGMLAGIITNGFLLTPGRIADLNAAGLDYLHLSIDNVHPDDTSRKSLSVIRRQLDSLARLADFDVVVNSVVGSGIRHPADASTIADTARTLGFASSVGLIHDGRGRLQPLNAAARQAWDTIQSSRRGRLGWAGNLYTSFNGFQQNLVNGTPNRWHCRAGARYLYVSEDGVVHYCSQQRGTPGIPLAEYTADDIRREFVSPKACAPYCTVACSHRVSMIDRWLRPVEAESPGHGHHEPAREQAS